MCKNNHNTARNDTTKPIPPKGNRKRTDSKGNKKENATM